MVCFLSLERLKGKGPERSGPHVREAGTSKALAIEQAVPILANDGCDLEPCPVPEPSEEISAQRRSMRRVGVVKVEINQVVFVPMALEAGLHVILHPNIATAPFAVFMAGRMQQVPPFGFEDALIFP
jgi:hypothetical protein